MSEKKSQALEKKQGGAVKHLTYKIAFPSEDGQFIAGHFGRAQGFVVVEIQGKQAISREFRLNDSHQDMPGHPKEGDHHEHHHEHEESPEEAQKKASAHSRIAAILHDVDILIANRIGPRAVDDLSAQGYTVITTDISLIDDAIQAYLAGKIKY